ncbi:hypothetical protein D9M68_241500 [compost metagenome]
MTLVDAMLALLLAAKLHGSDAAVRSTAKRCAQRLPRRQRGMMFTVAASSTPLQLVRRIADQLE